MSTDLTSFLRYEKVPSHTYFVGAPSWLQFSSDNRPSVKRDVKSFESRVQKHNTPAVPPPQPQHNIPSQSSLRYISSGFRPRHTKLQFPPLNIDDARRQMRNGIQGDTAGCNGVHAADRRPAQSAGTVCSTARLISAAAY